MCAGTKERCKIDGKVGDMSVSQDNKKTRYEAGHFASEAMEKDKKK